MATVCVDVGTTMIKAVGYDGDGAETVVVRRPTTISRPLPQWAEQDMTAVWEAVASAVHSVVSRLPAPVTFLAVTAQGDGCWLVDAHGEPTGPAILWNDGRATAIVDTWSRAGISARAFHRNGSLTFAGLPNAILSWLRLHDPDRLRRSATALTCGGWIFSRLTGDVAGDESDGSAPFMDIRSRRYAPELLQLYDLQWAERLLPPLRSDDRRVGTLRADAAARTGLPVGTPIVMGPYDIAATAIGVGAVEVGQACTILGTTLCTEMVTGAPVLDGEPAGLTVALGVPGRYVRAFPSLAGEEVLQWSCDLMQLSGPAELVALARTGTCGAGGLLFLPYLSPAGERAPFLDPLMRGTMVGLSFGHRRADVARAVLEGLTLVVADCLAASGVTPTELRVSGGGAASDGWLQLIADVTGLPVLRSVDTEPGARGAFLVGLVATGHAAHATAAVQAYVRNRDTFHPDPTAAAFYADMLADFLAVRGAIGDIGSTLATLRRRSILPAATVGEPV